MKILNSKNHSFSLRLSKNVMLVVNLFFIVVITIIAIFSYKMISEEAIKSSQNLLEANLAEIEKDISNIETQVCLVSHQVPHHLGDKQSFYDMTEEFLSDCENIMGTAIAFRPYYFGDKDYYFSPYSYRDSSNTIQTIQLGNDNYDYFSMEWYTAPKLSGKGEWAEPYFDEGGGQELMSTYSLPLTDEDGKFYAVMTADISLSDIADVISKIRPYESSFTVLVSKNGYLMAKKDSTKKTISDIAYSTNDPRALELATKMLAGERGIMKLKDKKNDCIAVYSSLPNGWSAVTICQYKDVLKQTIKMNIILLIVGVLGMLVVYILCYVTIKNNTKPLEQFSISTRKIAEGDFNSELPALRYNDEVKQLRDSFEYMQKSLTNYVETLKVTTAAKQMIESELSIATQIQQDMLPRDFPNNGNVDIHADLIPAKEVGGDLYDFIVKDKSIFFTVGDVSGKGVPASLIMAITKSTCGFVASSLTQNLADFMKAVNSFLSQYNEMNNFVTIFVGCYNIDTQTLEYCNGGHNPILLSKPDGEITYVKAIPNIPLGLFPDFEYKCESMKLSPGSRLLIYTDGVTEAETADKSLYGEERLMNVFRDAVQRNLNSEETTASVLKDVRAFADGNVQNDDITIMSIILKA